ncbi:MAG: metal ABC transporter ATP-binding protein [Tissierellia bacterium]|nr:metal ABC transporter ATP-binding protein [Tissierellia bacterium]
MKSIEVKNLNFGYTQDLVLKNLNFEVDEGELVTVVGVNGSGKSTLMKVMLGELKPLSGTVRLMGKDPMTMSSFKEVGYVPQSNVVNQIAFPITCIELVVLNLYEDFGLIKIPKKKHKQKAIDILKRLDLEEYINVPFNELSGGLQQRVMIARAMVNDPSILILDEPTAGVDDKSKGMFFDLIEKLNEEFNISIVLVTHELDLVREHLNLDNIYRIVNGELKNVAI